MDTLLFLNNGFVTSSLIRTCINSPYFTSPTSKSISSVDLRESPIGLPTCSFMAIKERSCILTQKRVSLIVIRLTCCLPSNSCRRMKFLSKFHGPSLITFIYHVVIRIPPSSDRILFHEISLTLLDAKPSLWWI